MVRVNNTFPFDPFNTKKGFILLPLPKLEHRNAAAYTSDLSVHKYSAHAKMNYYQLHNQFS